MYHFYADDGRILTPPKELESQLKDAFPAFSKLLGHLRLFYMTDEIWDGQSSLVFKSDREQISAVTFLSLTAEEVTSLVIPYCVKERLDALRKV